jgi:cytochrome P450
MIMSDKPPPDWDPLSQAVQRDQRAAYDAMRERCPVAYSDALGWSVFRHADVVRILHDPETFSNVVSSRRAVPNGMDPPEHTAYRRIVELYFSPERMAEFEPRCREIAARLVTALLVRDEVELIANFAQPFAVQAQCDFLGWPAHMHEPLRHWTLKNHGATAAQDRAALAEIAREFESYVSELLEIRRAAGAAASPDLTTNLMRQQVHGRPLHDDELVSILRNWTAGEVGTISAAVGILVQYLAEHAALQRQLRDQPSLLPAAIDEILRLHGPLVANRRVTTRPVEVGGRQIAAGERISLNWMAANRDGRVFPEPDQFRLDRDPSLNLLYGAGIHVCPGAPLARLELRVAMEELLRRTRQIRLIPSRPPTNATFPASGFADLPLQIK